jgi:hypothetical protein
MCAASKSASCSAKKGRRLDFPAIFFQHAAKALAHFGGGGFGEGDDEHFVERRAFAAEAIEAALDERVRFAGARAGHDEHVAARGDRLLLRRRQRDSFFPRDSIHCSRQSKVRHRPKVQSPKSGANDDFRTLEAGWNLLICPCQKVCGSKTSLSANVRANGSRRWARMRLNHAELIAILLRTGLKGANAVQVGQTIAAKFGSLQSLALASVDDLQRSGASGATRR